MEGKLHLKWSPCRCWPGVFDSPVEPESSLVKSACSYQMLTCQSAPNPQGEHILQPTVPKGDLCLNRALIESGAHCRTIPVNASDCPSQSSHGLKGKWEKKRIVRCVQRGWWGLRGGTCVVNHPCAAAVWELEPCLFGHNFSKQVTILTDQQAVNLNYGGGSWSLVH